MGRIKKKIKNHYEFKQFVKNHQEQDKKVVFTNGCFDILHFGHVDYLEKARELGDFLVIGINTDDSIKRIKGIDRPINKELDRMRLIAALDAVDAVTLFDDDTPKRLISDVLPNILVKGSDYTIDQIVGADEIIKQGGEVKTIDFVDGYSTTDLIKKIRE